MDESKPVAEYSAAWPQFLLAKRAILSEYDRAYEHAKTQEVVVHHGNVGEAAVRRWLADFLPRRFGVTSGYIRSQGATPHQTAHFDVIVYDHLEAPILWIEEHGGKADSGRSRIIPAEYVYAVLEVKAKFNLRSVDGALEKLSELKPLMAGVDEPRARYPQYFPASTVLGTLFIELSRDDAKDIVALERFRVANLNRDFYGGIVLRGAGRAENSTGLIRPMTSDTPMEEMFLANGLLHGSALTKTVEDGPQHCSAALMWSDTHFADFAFDLLAVMKGTYEPGRVSSFHGLDFSKWPRTK